MILEAEKWAKVKGFNAAYLWSYTGTEDFYKKCGYKKLIFGEYKEFFKKELKKKLKPKVRI